MYANGVLKEMAPRYMVPIQLNTLMAVKIPTNIESSPKAPPKKELCPATNKWCPQVKKPTKAIPMELKAMARYPKGFLREKAQTVSEITPIAGSTMMYTAGCE